jgi:hypothetical protein
LGWPQAKPVTLGQHHPDPVCPPDPPTDRDLLLRPPRSKYAEAAGVPSKRLDAWAVPDPTFGVTAPWLLGVVVGVSP